MPWLNPCRPHHRESDLIGITSPPSPPSPTDIYTQCLTMASGARQGRPPSTYGKLASAPSSNSSSSNARLTPDSDSDSELEMEEQGESYKMRPRADRAVGGDDDYEEEEEKYRRRRGTSISTVQSFQLYTPDEERAVVRKFDRKLVLFVALLYMLSFLDRSSLSSLLKTKLSTDMLQILEMQRSRALRRISISTLTNTNGL